jgi:hypothetical protein
MIDGIILYIQKLDWIAPALAGGIVDYLSIIRRDKRQCRLTNSIAHVVCALFFGWLVGEFSILTGWSQMSGGMTIEEMEESQSAYTIAVALGGLMGTRIGEIIVFVIKKKAGLLVDD